MKVRFWGTRGGTPVPGPSTLRYGGNTSCVEVSCGPHRIILDAGTGLRNLGDSCPPGPFEADLLFSHFHLDHLLGLCFFRPLYRSDTVLRLHAGIAPDEVRAILHTLLRPPLMPALLETVVARIDVHGFRPEEDFAPHAGITVRTARLNHPGGSVGYRIEWAGRSLAYVTDTEHEPSRRDPAVLRLVRNADLLIYDSSYTDAELPDHVGWGHSTWQEAIRIADAAGVGRLVLFHHDPRRDDDALDLIAGDASRQRAGTVTATEGMTLTV